MVEANGAGAQITDDIRFAITYEMTDPYSTIRVLRGTIKAGTITPTSVGTVQIQFDSGEWELMGSDILLTTKNMTPKAPNVSGGSTDVGARVSAAAPIRLVVTSTGYVV